MFNPFKTFVVVGFVIAAVAAAGFFYTVFVNPGNNGSLNIDGGSSASETE